MGYPIAPNGNIYTCWRYILERSEEGILGNFFDEDFQFNDDYFECKHYGDCNACGWNKNIIDKETGKQLDTDVIGWDYLC
jgi:radical SAM protein with 4Fe4S-binding SPASM domain